MNSIREQYIAAAIVHGWEEVGTEPALDALAQLVLGEVPDTVSLVRKGTNEAIVVSYPSDHPDDTPEIHAVYSQNGNLGPTYSSIDEEAIAVYVRNHL